MKKHSRPAIIVFTVLLMAALIGGYQYLKSTTPGGSSRIPQAIFGRNFRTDRQNGFLKVRYRDLQVTVKEDHVAQVSNNGDSVRIVDKEGTLILITQTTEQFDPSQWESYGQGMYVRAKHNSDSFYYAEFLVRDLRTIINIDAKSEVGFSKWVNSIGVHKEDDK